MRFTYSVVELFIIVALRSSSQIGDSFDLSRFYLHHDNGTMLCFIFFQLLQKSMMCNVLNSNINRGNHIITILRLYFIFVINGFPLTLSNLLLESSAIFTFQIFTVGAFKSHTYCMTFFVYPFVTHHPLCNFPDGVLTHCALLNYNSSFVRT